MFLWFVFTVLGADPATTLVTPSAAAAHSENSSVAKQTSKDSALRQKARFSFEFAKAEIMDVVKAIADITQQNFIVPERIKGQRVTILSPGKITAEEAYQVFFTALSVNGISLVRSGKFYKLLDSRDAIHDTIPTCIDDENGCSMFHEQMVTLLLHLRHTDATQVTAVVKSLLSKDGDVNIFQASNALIVSEYAPNLKRVRRIIEALDVPGSDDRLQLLPILHTTAAEIADKLTQIFEVQAHANTPRPGGVPGVVGQASAAANDDTDVQISKIIPDERTNQIIIKANKRSVESVKKIIAKLDVPIGETEQGRLHVYYLANAKAEDLAGTLSSLAQGPAPSSGSGTNPRVSPPGPGASSLRNTSPDTSAIFFDGEVKITADKATNSLLIMSSAHDYRALRILIEKLDKPRRQVYVEAAILEVNLTDSEQSGTYWHLPQQWQKAGQLGPLPSKNTFGFLQSAQSGSDPSPTFTALAGLNYLLKATGGSVGGILGAPLSNPITLSDGSTISIPSFGVILKWLETTSHANILSTPHMLTTDNEQAQIEVGEKIPFNSGLFGSLGAGIPPVSPPASGATNASPMSNLGSLGALGGLGAVLGAGAVQRIDVSLKLSLTPQINEHNKIRMEIDQNVEDVIGEESRTQTPTTAHRSLKTVVVVDDQQTIVLGGLMRDRATESESKIPFLGDLPLIGYFFKQQNTKVQKVNLLLVLTPYIISTPTDFQRIFERKMQENEEFAAQYYGDRQEYRAHIDYSKKTGPFARIVKKLRHEHELIENGGAGDGSEMLIKPAVEGPPSADADDTNEAAPVAPVPEKGSHEEPQS